MRVWLYYRLSRDEDDELNSLTNQRKIIYEYAVTNGHEVVGESFDDKPTALMVRVVGLEPTRLTAEEPKSSESTISTIPADMSGRVTCRYFILL